MANSAQYLLQLFNEEPREEGETFDLRRVMLAVGDVDRQLNGLIALGVSRFEAYRKGMPELWEKHGAHSRTQRMSMRMSSRLSARESCPSV